MYLIRLSKLNFVAILVYLIPLGLLSGAFIPDLFLSIVSIVFIIITIQKKLYHLYKGFFAFFIIFYFYIVFASLMSEYQLFSLKSSLPYLRFVIFALAVSYLIDNKKNFLEHFFYFFYFTFVLALISGYVQYFYGYSVGGIATPEPNRLSLVFNDKMYLGGYISRMLPFLIGLMIYVIKPSRLTNIIFYITVLLSIILIFLSGERTSFLLCILSFLFLSLFISQLKKIKLISISILVIILLIIFAISLYDNGIKERQFDHTISQTNILENPLRPKLFSIEHEVYFFNAYQMFNSNLLLGIGPNGFREECKKYPVVQDHSCSTHPHNNYIQIAAETGIIGSIFLLGLALYLLINMIRHIISNFKKEIPYFSDYQICIMCCFFLTLWPIIPTQNLFNNYINIIYYLPIGFYLQSTKLKT